MSKPKNILIMGAAGRDFHTFNTCFRDDPNVRVVAFTATQIPDIDGRRYPAALAGEHYTNGIPIEPEEHLRELIIHEEVNEVVFAYSDVAHEYVMHKASFVNSLGASFRLLGADETMLPAKVPVVSVCAVRTGCGKSQTTRKVAALLKEAGKRVVVIRHPMPYGNLEEQRCQRFASLEDLSKHNCTIEEMEEYEPHIDQGFVVFAGVDYQEILSKAEAEADVILWDGGNNDTPFFKSDFEIVLVDPHRVGHETTYYPGEVNLLRAKCVVINKVDSANHEDVAELRETLRFVNPKAAVIEAASPITVPGGDAVVGKRVLVVEDGPTLTHGEMPYGAGVVAAEKLGASQLVDPRPFAVGSIIDLFDKYQDLGPLLPAMGYGDAQIKDLETTINNSDADMVLCATPIDLGRIISCNKPMVRARYELQEIGSPTLGDVLAPILS